MSNTTLEEYLRKQNERNKRWQAKNPEKVKAYQKKYYAANKEKLREYKKKWRKAYVERLRAEAASAKNIRPQGNNNG